jgi:HAD superfamily hydrolase (TIGR01490 family)
MMQGLSIYDLDKTITRGATFIPFLQHAVIRLAPWRLMLLPIVMIVTLAYGLKFISRRRLKEINLGLLVGRSIDSSLLQNVSRSFAVKTLENNVLSKAIEQIAKDRAEGRRIVIASASYRFYVSEIAHLLAIDDVIATATTTLAGGLVSPRIDGENCYGPAKLSMIEAWMVERKIARGEADIRFYSDHISDVPSFDFADQAIVTNPHPPLRAYAITKGWPVHDWSSQAD